MSDTTKIVWFASFCGLLSFIGVLVTDSSNGFECGVDSGFWCGQTGLGLLTVGAIVGTVVGAIAAVGSLIARRRGSR